MGGNTTGIDQLVDFKAGALGQCTYVAAWVVNS